MAAAAVTVYSRRGKIGEGWKGEKKAITVVEYYYTHFSFASSY